MPVVVTGGSGNVGTSVIEALTAEPGLSLRAVARRVPNLSFPNTVWVGADVRTDDLTAHFNGADAVVHLAWLIQPSRDPCVTWQANVVGSIRVFQAAARRGSRVGVRLLGGRLLPGAGVRGGRRVVADRRVPTAAYSREKSLRGASVGLLRAAAPRGPGGPATTRVHLQAGSGGAAAPPGPQSPGSQPTGAPGVDPFPSGRCRAALPGPACPRRG